MLADGGQRSVEEDMREVIEGMAARMWKGDKARLAAMLPLM